MAKEKIEVESVEPMVLEAATKKVIAKETRNVFWGQPFSLVEGKEVEIPTDLYEEWEKLGLCK